MLKSKRKNLHQHIQEVEWVPTTRRGTRSFKEKIIRKNRTALGTQSEGFANSLKRSRQLSPCQLDNETKEKKSKRETKV